MSFRDEPMREPGMTRQMEASRPFYQAEHYLAWFFALGAIVLGVIGLLRGFGLIGDTGADKNPLFDGFVWMLPAISSALVSFGLHRSDHHRSMEMAPTEEEDRLFQAEHWGAYLVALVTIVTGALALLVGFDLFDSGNTQADGWLWGLSSIGTGVLVNTLHAVRHHQMAEDEDYIVSILERRVSMAPPPMGGTSRQPGTEPRP